MANKLFGDSAAGNIKSVDFTNSKIETFTAEAFDGCSNLEKITFGETCGEIMDSALSYCDNLKQIVFEGTNPPIIDAQNFDFSSIIIEVPEGKEQAYQAALEEDNPGATVTAEEDILRYTSTKSLLSNQWLFDENNGAAAKWSETEIPGEITGEELCARFSWSGEYKGEPVSGTFDAQIEKNGYNGYIDNMTGTAVYPQGEDGELLVYADKGQEVLLFTIQPYSELSEKTEYTDQGYTYSFVNIEKPVYGESTYEGVVVLKSDVISVGNNAFQNDTTLITIKLPQQITSIGDAAFSSCTNLTSIEIPSGLTSIGDAAFSSCTNLTSINIPSSVTSIGVNAFYSCTSLTSINIPSSVTSIGVSAFNGCTNLTSINIPSSVTSIGDGAFSSCTSLASIDLPSSVETIEYYAFANCSGVSSVICRAATPPTLTTEKDKIWFSGLQTDTCQVPAESISAYEGDTNWSSQFKSFVAIQ